MRRLEFVTFVPGTLPEVWNFFSSPSNLEKITPKSMNFKVFTPVPLKMYPGLVVGYRVSPLPVMRVTWLTEITHVSEHNYFVDEQRIGPYSIWHHEHHFKESKQGIEMVDILTYHLPLGILGKLVDWLVVKQKVNSIFTFREKRIREIFPV